MLQPPSLAGASLLIWALAMLFSFMGSNSAEDTVAEMAKLATPRGGTTAVDKAGETPFSTCCRSQVAPVAIEEQAQPSPLRPWTEAPSGTSKRMRTAVAVTSLLLRTEIKNDTGISPRVVADGGTSCTDSSVSTRH